MILPDLNLLVYAYNADAPLHAEARRWWEGLMNGDQTVGVAWVVGLGFIRLMTHPRVVRVPLPAERAVGYVASWLDRPQVRVIEPGRSHLDVLERLLVGAGAAGALTTDAHLAALALEYAAEVHTNDADFARFPGIRHVNPLQR